ncbi:MAG: DUF554 domain-containing protein [Flexilinea sp.]
MIPYGVIADSSAVLIGGISGAYLGKYLPERVKETLPIAFGFAAMAIGITLVAKVSALTPVVLALIIGTFIGEILELDQRVRESAQKLAGMVSGGSKNNLDIITSMLILFCASGTGIFGSMNSGFIGDHSILYMKAILDFFTAMIFGAVAGKIIAMICVPQFVINGLLFYLSTLILPLTNTEMLKDFSASGGIINLAIGFNIIKLKNTRLINLLPALILVMVFSKIWSLLAL